MEKFQDLTNSQKEEIFKYISGKDIQDVYRDSDELTKIIVKKISRVVERKTKINKIGKLASVLTKGLDDTQYSLFIGSYEDFTEVIMLNRVSGTEWRGTTKEGVLYYIYDSDGRGSWVISNVNDGRTFLATKSTSFSGTGTPNGTYINGKSQKYAEIFDRTLLRESRGR